MKCILLLFIWVTGLAACAGRHMGNVLEVQESAPREAERSMVVAAELSNQKVTSMAEDADGHLWIGTFRGLNKYNAHEYHQYYSTTDSLSLPDNQVNDLLTDSKGRLWVATVNGVCLYTDHGNFRQVRLNCENRNGVQLFESKDGRIFLNMMHQLCAYNEQTDAFDCIHPAFDWQHTFHLRCFIDPQNKLWAATPVSLRRYNSATLELEDSIPLLERGTFGRFYLHTDGCLWMAGERSMAVYDTRLRRFAPVPECLSRHPQLGSATVLRFHPYGSSSLLLNTDRHGMFLYNYRTHRVVHQGEAEFPFDAPTDKVSRLFTDSQQNLWIGTVDQGVQPRYHYKERFNTNNFLRQAMQNKSVTALAIDRRQNLYIATLRHGLYIYNLASQQLRQVDVTRLFRYTGAREVSVSALMVDDEQNLWLAAKWVSKVIRCRLDGGELRVTAEHDLLFPSTFMQDAEGTVWVGCGQHVLYGLRRGAARFEPLQAFAPYSLFVNGLLPAAGGSLWAAAFMSRPVRIAPRTWKWEEVSIADDDWARCIPRSVFIPTCLMQDSRGLVWIGTVTNGLMHYDPDTHRLTPVPGAPCTDICSMVEDAQGNVWVSTQYGLGKYDRTVGRFTNYYKADGIGGNQFYERCACLLPDGQLVFGGTHGLTAFNPIDVNVKRTVPLVFQDLKVHNRLVTPGQPGSPIATRLSLCPGVRLSHRQNGFSLSFAALDYNENERVHYSYLMEGFDKYWIDARGNREAYYANLPAGCYTFRVRITNNDRSIVPVEGSLRIHIAPSPWASWWAWCIYLLLAAAVVGLFVRALLRIRAEKAAAYRAELAKEQELRTNRMNMSFFANVSHEFRTPLTMITGPVNQLCADDSIGGGQKQLLLIIQRSVARMLKLVNQLMDFNKLENDTLRLQVQRMDIIALLQRMVDVFTVNACNKGIRLATRGLEDTFLTWVDEDKIDKIFGNLMGNALKFTPQGGDISVSFDVITGIEAGRLFGFGEADMAMQYIKVVVQNSGASIPTDRRERIFERYYQLDGPSGETYNWGTGIGLYYARALVRLHHGHIGAFDPSPGMGACFVVILPVGDEAYAPAERMAEALPQAEQFPLPDGQCLAAPAAGDEAPAASRTDDDEKKFILVVDDDTEVAHYLQVLLSPHYRVVCRFSADDALKLLGEEATDLIVSDVVMPGKDGYQLCREVKADTQLCHIPVILVTAKATVENQVEGLETGADAYVTKPFDPQYLLALVSSQLKNREKVHSLLNRSTQTDKIEADVLLPQDNAFMTDLYRLMEAELSNTELDVARMTELLHISRTKFYYKVKGLTGQNPGAFFKTYKLNRAAELMREGRYNVSEIADMTGFSTLSHFSTSFKKQFGTSPSEYGKS